DEGDRKSEPFDTGYVTGCVIMAPAAVFRTVGLLEAKFYLTFEDADWSYRVRRAGYRCMVEPRAKVWHKVSRSFRGAKSPLWIYFMTRNLLFWIERNVTMREKLTAYRSAFRLLWNEFKWVQAASFMRRMLARFVMAAAVLDYALRRFGDCPQWVRRVNAW
ncbi:MAG: hypothetical protein NTZ05_11190, partial [Chloroflexi bacterium]|nr:hypothetical protein [Chloroflexota bacterium]